MITDTDTHTELDPQAQFRRFAVDTIQRYIHPNVTCNMVSWASEELDLGNILAAREVRERWELDGGAASGLTPDTWGFMLLEKQYFALLCGGQRHVKASDAAILFGLIKVSGFDQIAQLNLAGMAYTALVGGQTAAETEDARSAFASLLNEQAITLHAANPNFSSGMIF